MSWVFFTASRQTVVVGLQRTAKCYFWYLVIVFIAPVARIESKANFTLQSLFLFPLMCPYFQFVSQRVKITQRKCLRDKRRQQHALRLRGATKRSNIMYAIFSLHLHFKSKKTFTSELLAQIRLYVKRFKF